MRTISHVIEKRQVYNSKYLTLSQKIRQFREFANSICEQWTNTNTVHDNIDYFNRRQLQYALGIKYPIEQTNNSMTSQNVSHGAVLLHAVDSHGVDIWCI